MPRTMYNRPILPSVVLIILLFPAISPSRLWSSERSISVIKRPRIALVVGNGTYATAPLKNPRNDATDMAAVLASVGFDVRRELDADKRTMEEAIRDFGRNLNRGGIGLFFYAGHGMQVDGINYLIPVKTRIEKEEDIRYEAVDAGRVLAEMESAGNGLNVVILDACRDNPLSRSFRSCTKGPTRVDASTGTLIA